MRMHIDLTHAGSRAHLASFYRATLLDELSIEPQGGTVELERGCLRRSTRNAWDQRASSKS